MLDTGCWMLDAGCSKAEIPSLAGIRTWLHWFRASSVKWLFMWLKKMKKNSLFHPVSRNQYPGKRGENE